MKLMELFIFISIAVPLQAILVFGSAHATNCKSCRVDPVSRLSDLSGLLTPAQWIEGSDRHVSVDDPAVGTIECNNLLRGSASVIGRRDVIVTAAHVLYDKTNGCAPMKGCEFVTIDHGVEVRRAIGAQTPRSCPITTDLDWDVATLTSSVPTDVEPLQVGETTQGERVTALNGANYDFIEMSKKNKGRPIIKNGDLVRMKTSAPCDNLGPGAAQFTDLIMTNCSAAILSSGSPLLNSNHQISGIVIKSTQSMADIDAKFDKGDFKVEACKFDPQKCATYYRAIDGDFKKAIEAAITGQNI